MNHATQSTPDRTAHVSQLISNIACALVDHPDKVSVEYVEDSEHTLIRLRVHPEDVGKLIGKEGRTARSLRTILIASGTKLRHRFSLDIVEETESGGNGNRGTAK